jgi:uncharacterized protein with HEPN domain
MSVRDSRVTLRQLADFIDEAQGLVEGRTLEALASDPVRLRAFERVMELVGECAKRVPAELREKYPDVPWRQIAGMRDVISHAYEDLAYEILWSAAEKDFPKLKREVERMVRELSLE